MPDAPLDSWRLVFDPAVASKVAKCGISVLDSPAEMMRAVLNYLGRIRLAERGGLQDAEAVLLKIRPYIRNIIPRSTSRRSPTAIFALRWLQRRRAAGPRPRPDANKGIEIKYMVPKEGSILWFDMLAVPKDAPDPESAYAYINYIMTRR